MTFAAVIVVWIDCAEGPPPWDECADLLGLCGVCGAVVRCAMPRAHSCLHAVRCPRCATPWSYARDVARRP